MERLVDQALAALAPIPDHHIYGRVTKILGLLIEIAGFPQTLTIGARVSVESAQGPVVPAEVVGFRDGHALLLPFGPLEGIGLGARALMHQGVRAIYPSNTWLGRVINGLAEPIDGRGPLLPGPTAMPLKAAAPPAHARSRMGQKLDLGVRVMNTFLATCQGQRMGIFSGSGVGKSVLLSMMARYTAADVAVIGLIGERGREVQEFLMDDLGPDGLARSVVVVATGDEPALKRRQAAYVTMAIAEYFRAEGKQVLCLMDSVTRFAMAQREIGLSAGEPPTSKGYPPTTFGELARLLERAGPGQAGEGAITGLFSVLVEGDDPNEPISDAVRGILDGHIVMERAIADRGRYPAVNVLKSVSRSLPQAFDDEQNAIIRKAKQVISAYEDMAELIRLGAYRKGSDAKVDEAIRLYPDLEAFLTQAKGDHATIDESFARLAGILAMPYRDAAAGAAPASGAAEKKMAPAPVKWVRKEDVPAGKKA
jgi:flagellum-specific ATP synthase